MTKPELLERYVELLSTSPSAAYRYGVEHHLRSKDMARASEHAKIRSATEFHVVFFIGRDPREDRGVVRKSLYEVVEGIPTVGAARDLVQQRGADQYGRRGIIRAILGGGQAGIHVGDDFDG